MLVTIIGLTALARSRVQFRSAVALRDSVQVRFAAQAAVELALARMDAVDDWRNGHASNEWVALATMGGVEVSYKLVDEDGDLGDDPDDPVRVYGRAQSGTATRIYSVEIDVETEEPTVVNLLDNGGFENGMDSWSPVACGLQSSSTDPYAGGACMRVISRIDGMSGPRQETPWLEHGTEYFIELWVRMHDAPTTSLRPTFVIDRGAAGTAILSFTASAGTGWTRCGHGRRGDPGLRPGRGDHLHDADRSGADRGVHRGRGHLATGRGVTLRRPTAARRSRPGPSSRRTR
jgi:hypothetical protein